MNILYVDVETSPMLAYTWDTRPQYIPKDMLLQDKIVLTWAAQWHGKTTIKGDKLTPDEVLARDDKRIIASLAKLVREADVVIAHNADRFDLPLINGRVMYHAIEPLGPVKTIDTLKLVKKSFKLPYNSLGYLAEWLFGDNKSATSMRLWKRCMEGDYKALAYMLRYNRKDVKLLAELLERIKPYVSKLARLYDGPGCPSCGAGDLMVRGYHRTNASTFVKLQCQECGRYCRQRSSEKALNPEYVPL